jgi:outer membrane protease
MALTAAKLKKSEVQRKGHAVRYAPKLGLLMVALLTIVNSLTAEPVHAQELSLSVSSGTGIMYGTAKEFALDNGFAISELDWTIQPLYFAQNTLDLKALGGLHASVAVRTGFPMYSGQMTDSDWLNYEVNGDASKTNFSQSNCYTERAILVDASAGWEFQVGAGFSVEPFLAFGYMSWEWTARDGYLQYPSAYPSSPPPYPAWSSSQPKVPIYGTGIVYSQTYLIPAAGARLRYRLGKKWRLALAVSASPYVYCTDQDDHIFNGVEYTDVMGSGWMIEPELSAEVQLSGRVLLSAGASYRHIARLVGDDKAMVVGAGSGAGTQATYTNGGGASYDALSVWLNLSVSF